MNSEKQIIFISHANPQDNEATTWLASKLTCEGYKVWTDLTKLFGGDYFWDGIEEQIRDYTVKFISLVSKNSKNAQGFLDELNLAILIERKNNIKRFVVPIRLDSIPFDEFKVNIARKYAIDFSKNWAEGFNELLKLLEEDKVTKSVSDGSNKVTEWFKAQNLKYVNIKKSPQIIASNWIPIIDIPDEIKFSRIPVPELEAPKLVERFNYPAFSYQQFIYSYADSKELQPFMPNWLALTHGFNVISDELINGTVNLLPNINWQDGQNMVSGLLKKAWNMEMTNRGLKPYVLSDYSTAWFMPKGLFENDNIEYKDLDNVVRKKKIIGRSNKFNVYWHFAVSAQPFLTPLKRYSLRTHVVFTSDGITPIESKSRMHSLRRGFCRSWWNERWRGLLYAYLVLISNNDKINIKVSSNKNINCSSKTFSFSSPLSIEESNVPYVAIPDDVVELYEEDYQDYLLDEELEEDLELNQEVKENYEDVQDDT